MENSFLTILLAIALGVVGYITKRQEATNKRLEIELEDMRKSTESAKAESAEAVAQAAQVQGALGAVNTLAGGITELARSIPASINKLGKDVIAGQTQYATRIEQALGKQGKVIKDYMDEVRSTNSTILQTIDRAITMNGQRIDHMETNLKTEMARIRQEFIELENQVKALPRLDGEIIIKAINDTGERIMNALEKRQNGETLLLQTQPIVQ